MTQGYRCGVHPQSSWRANCTIAWPDEAGAGKGPSRNPNLEQRSCADYDSELVHGRGKRRASAAATDDGMVKEWRRWWWCRTDRAD
ncbi:unnamed protein product [Calypogeia fissa]